MRGGRVARTLWCVGLRSSMLPSPRGWLNAKHKSGFRWNEIMTNSTEPLKTLKLGRYRVDQMIPSDRDMHWRQ